MNAICKTERRCLRARDALEAASTLYHVVAICTEFQGWPSWGDEVLLRWMRRQAAGVILAEFDESSPEHLFVLRHRAGMLII
jgi:hypothetical protein